MAVWKISGNDLPVFYIKADSFDKALSIAIQKNDLYNASNVQMEYVTLTYRVFGKDGHRQRKIIPLQGINWKSNYQTEYSRIADTEKCYLLMQSDRIGDKMPEKRIALGRTIQRVGYFMDVLSADIETIEMCENKSGKTCDEFNLEKKYKNDVLQRLCDIKKELIRNL